MFKEFGAQALQTVEAEVLAIADGVAKDIKVSVEVDPNIIHEAFAAASSSVQFHRIEQPNQYKELAHIGFWIAELKPVSIAAPKLPHDVRKAALATLHATDAGLFGSKAYSKASSIPASEVVSGYHENATFPINEYVAVELINRYLASAFQKDFENRFTGRAERKIIVERYEYFQEILYGNIADHMVSGLRFHIFTPRSFATLIECVFMMEGSHDFHKD